MDINCVVTRQTPESNRIVLCGRVAIDENWTAWTDRDIAIRKGTALGRGLMGIGGVLLPKLGTHPLLLHTKLGPEHEEY